MADSDGFLSGETLDFIFDEDFLDDNFGEIIESELDEVSPLLICDKFCSYFLKFSVFNDSILFIQIFES